MNSTAPSAPGSQPSAEPNYRDVPHWVRPTPLTGPVWTTVAFSAATMALLAAWFAWVMPGNGWVPYLVCAVPPLAAALATLADPADRRQYVLRPVAAAMFLPILVGFYAGEADGHWGALAIGSLVLWFVVLAAGFGGLVVLQASTATRLDSGIGASPAAAAQRMVDALVAMAATEPRLRLRRGTDGQSFTLEHATGESRRQRFEMRIDATTGTVRVREVASAQGAAPAGAEEASMRGPGDHWFDPARPDAAKTWARSWAATMIEPHRLGGVAFDAASPAPTPTALAAAVGDADALPHLLAATALRAGMHWRPTLGRP